MTRRLLLYCFLLTGCATTQNGTSHREVARACLEGDLDACSRRALEKLETERNEESPASKRTLDELCRAGHVPSCIAPWEDEDFCRSNHNECVAERMRLCDAGIPHMCFLAGRMMRDPELVYFEDLGPEEDAALRGLMERSCNGGVMKGCLALAELDRDRTGGPAELAVRADRLRRACEGGLPRACALYAPLLRDGIGTRIDPEKARRIARAACFAGESEMCEANGPRQQNPSADEANRSTDQHL